MLLDSQQFPLSGQQLIEASAGTGKTYTISNLYLRLLLGRDPTLSRPLLPSEILVLTFTIAATDELRDRIRNRVNLARAMFARQLVKAENRETSGVQTDAPEDSFIETLIADSRDLIADRRLLTAALQTMDEASIFTIHGFCARILGEQAFDTGMLFNQNLDGDRDQLLETAAQDCFRQELMPLPTAIRNIALKRWSNPDALVKFVRNFLFRHNLQYLPPEQPVGDELDQLIADNQSCKALWLEQNLSEVIREAEFHGRRTTALHVKPDHPGFIEQYCHSAELDIMKWDPWTSEKLEKNTTKTTIMPEHEIFDLIDSIVARQTLIDTISNNLCHLVARNISNNMAGYKAQLGQLTLDDLLVEVHRALDNPLLASVLQNRWPVAMIDEFQDTDDLQFEIFTRVYGSSSKKASNKAANKAASKAAQKTGGLFFIGDPKQAIYNFRGADVYTYINAKQGADATYSLGTNWRSTPAMIAAINHLFDRPNIFGNDQQIPFEPVSHAEPNANKALTIDGVPQTPMPIFVSQDSSEEVMRESLMAHAAEETVRLLQLAQEGRAKINGKLIEPGQIAFLVRQRKDANAARRALSARNIRSVYVTLESVLLSETADDLKLILEAVIDPTNERALKTALATRLLQSTASEIFALNKDWSALHDVMEEFQEYHQLWATMEIAPMIEHMMSRRKIPEKWLLDSDGERQMTNLRHLAEILQTRSIVAPGMRRLLKWFNREKLAVEAMAVDERQLRLESDSNLVQIVTMHASKGLEYDVVMIPYAGFGKPFSTSNPMFHQKDQRGNFVPSIDFSNASTSKTQYQLEEFNESMRLMYVAMTRAKYACYIGVPLIKQIQNTPIAALLGFNGKDSESVTAELETLPKELFTIQALCDDRLSRFSPETKASDLTMPLTLPLIQSHWRMHSYTGLTRLLKQDEPELNGHQPRPGYGDDDTATAAPASTAPSKFTFPRGSRVGIVLHDFMEQLDFSADETQVSIQAERSLGKIGLMEPEWCEVLIEWFADIVQTPMSTEHSFTLADVSTAKRLDEMEFHFPIQANRTLVDQLKASGVLSDHMNLEFDTLQGMMTGYIDLIVAHEGQYFLIDYKSNDLGANQAAYSEAALTDAVKHHHYDLQYLIYCVALNRYLKQRLPDYDYAKHFGGVFYLFLRGMDRGVASGIYADRPTEALVNQLDLLLTASRTL